MFLNLERQYLELIYILKEGSEFGKNDIFERAKFNVIQGICMIIVELLN